MGLLRRSVYNQKDTIVTIRPWVDTTYLDNGIEVPYNKYCNINFDYISNHQYTYSRVFLDILSSNNTWYNVAISHPVVVIGTNNYELQIHYYNNEPHTYRIKIEVTNRIGVFSSNYIYIVGDIDGNIYNLTKIGSQWWTCENMRAVHYADGTALTNGGTSSSRTTPYYYEYIKDGENLFEKAPLLGRLYNWPAATKSSDGSSDVNIQGLAPTGFHIPSNSEFQTLIDTVANGDTAYAARLCDDRYYKQFPTQGLDYNQYYKWTTSYSNENCGNYNTEDRNISMFCTLPAGRCDGGGSFGGFKGLNDYTDFWSSTPNGSNLAYKRYLGYNSRIVGHNSYSRDCGYPVRCICNYDLDQL